MLLPLVFTILIDTLGARTVALPPCVLAVADQEVLIHLGRSGAVLVNSPSLKDGFRPDGIAVRENVLAACKVDESRFMALVQDQSKYSVLVVSLDGRCNVLSEIPALLHRSFQGALIEGMYPDASGNAMILIRDIGTNGAPLRYSLLSIERGNWNQARMSAKDVNCLLWNASSRWASAAFVAMASRSGSITMDFVDLFTVRSVDRSSLCELQGELICRIDASSGERSRIALPIACVPITKRQRFAFAHIQQGEDHFQYWVSVFDGTGQLVGQMRLPQNWVESGASIDDAAVRVLITGDKGGFVFGADGKTYWRQLQTEEFISQIGLWTRMVKYRAWSSSQHKFNKDDLR